MEDDNDMTGEQLPLKMGTFEVDRSPVSRGVDIVDEKQFTLRSVLVGGLVGAVVCVSNLYFMLKIGWGLGASLTSAILGFAIFKVLPAKYSEGFGPKENCTLQSAGTAAGLFTAGYSNAIPALMMLGRTFRWYQLLVWTFCCAFLGVFFAVPLRTHAILRQKLRFPTGTATAEVIQSMHASSTNASIGIYKAKVLMQSCWPSCLWILITFFIPFLYNIPLFYWLGLPQVDAWNWNLNLSPAFFGAGMLIDLRVTLSMFCSAIFCWGFAGPLLVQYGWVETAFKFSATSSSASLFLLWVGIAMMVAQQIVSLLLLWKPIIRGFCPTTVADVIFTTVSRVTRRPDRFHGLPSESASESLSPASSTGSAQATTFEEEDIDPTPESERIPASWWMSGYLISSIACIIVVTSWFDMLIQEVILAIFLGSLFAIVGVQATGETDITPISVIGNMTQLIMALVRKGDSAVYLMAANITGASAMQATDMMQDLKTGHLLKASPRAQFFAELVGGLFGAVFSVAGWYIFSTAYEIGGDEFPAIGARNWLVTSQAFANGFSNIPKHVGWFCLVGAIFGGLEPLVKLRWPLYAEYLPNIMGISLGFMIPQPGTLATMFFGSLALKWWQRRDKDQSDELSYAVASGMCAGEGVMGVVAAFMQIVGLSSLATDVFCYGHNC